MRIQAAATLMLYAIWNCSAAADVAINEQIMQKGQFIKSGCQSDVKDPDYDACTCDADIRYPQIANLDNPVTQGKFNDWFRDQAAKTVCEGTKVPSQAESRKNTSTTAHASISVHYETTFVSAPILGFKFTDWAYTGGAHGNGTVIGVILNTQTGKFLTSTDIFSAKNLAAVNKAIYRELAGKPEEEIFRDRIEARHGKFIKNGECEGCTLVLTPKGIHVLFQTYEVAPYGAGNTDVPIALKYVANTLVAQAIATQNDTKVEKQ